jgi:hypothetical protein
MEKKIYFKGRGGTQLCGLLTIPKKDTNKCIVLCHGLGAGADKEEHGVFEILTARLAQRGFATFRFDFRGRGESEGDVVDLTVSGEEEDIESAFRLMMRIGYDTFGIVAASFAGGAVLGFVPKHEKEVRALILWNSVIDYRYFWDSLGEGGLEEMKRKGYAKRRGLKLGKKLFNETMKLKPWKKLGRLGMPVLFIHGDKDVAVKYSDAVKYSRMYHSRLVTIHGAEHGFHNSRKYAEQASKAAADFFVQKL